MASCERLLADVVRQIEPTPTQKQGASRSHAHLRDTLDTGKFGDRIIDSYLSGSYARDTAITPLDDVDIIVVVDPHGWINNDNFLFPTKPRPSAILSSFAAAIRYRYPSSSVFIQRRSVRLSLYHLDIDVVPAIEVEERSNIVWIPDRQKNDWIKSAPKNHSVNASRVNQLQGGLFKPLVKLLKYWNTSIPSKASFKSFGVETIAVRLFSTVKMQSLEHGALIFFDFLSQYHGTFGQKSHFRWSTDYGMTFNWLTCEVPDACNTGSNTCAGVDSAKLEKFTYQALRSRDAMLAAANARTDNGAEHHAARALKLRF